MRIRTAYSFLLQLCKSFIVKTVLPSRTRTAALAKYLVTLSKSCPPRDADAKVDTTKPGDENEGLGKIINGKFPQPPEPAFRRLHILYILHDVLVFIHHHLARSRHSYESSIGRVALDQLRPAISTLAELAACGCSGKASKSCPYVLDLITFWKTMQIFPPNDLDDLRDRVLLADTADWDSTLSKLAAEDAGRVEQQRKDEENESQWILPDRHGVINDPTAPWHELPAANGLYMKRTRGYPLRAGAFPQGGFSLKNGGECTFKVTLQSKVISNNHQATKPAPTSKRTSKPSTPRSSAATTNTPTHPKCKTSTPWATSSGKIPTAQLATTGDSH